MRILFLTSLLLLSSISLSATVWTDNHWRGQGVSVTNVYLQWDNHWVQFFGSDGKSYYYYWGTENTPTEKAKLFFTMLLTAFTSGKKVSIAYQETPDTAGHHSFSFLNLHD